MAEPGSVCTNTYNVVGPFDTDAEQKRILDYLNTNFARHLITIIKCDQHSGGSVLGFIPMPRPDEPIDDEYFFNKYNYPKELREHAMRRGDPGNMRERGNNPKRNRKP